jgi:hypothetical protein
MRKGRLAILSMIAVLIAVMVAGPAGATGKTYTATLSGGEEVPPRTTTAAGKAEFRVSDDGKSITYKVTITNEITNLVAGHIHVGKKGENGAVVVNLVPAGQPGNGKKSGVVGEGTITAANLAGPMAGKTIADLIAALDSGDTYVNLHTNDGTEPQNSGPGDFPGGEIRGQIVAGMPGLPSTGAGGAQASSLPLAVLLGSVLLGLVLACALEARRRFSHAR